jgi:membrane protein involved in D-alanine export
MTPFADLPYFGLLLYIIVPTVVMRILLGRVPRAWILGITVLMVSLQLWTPVALTSRLIVNQLWIAAFFLIFQYLVAQLFLRRRSKTARVLYPATIVLSLLPLAVAKFLPSIGPGSQLGFMGISYVTFRALDIIFGIEDGLILALPPVQFLTFLFFFPTVSSGPIDRFRRFAEDWNQGASRSRTLADFDGAIHRIFTGFLYKFIIAYQISVRWMVPASTGHGPGAIISYMYAYSFYLFFDFAGYSCFAIGVSRFFGIRTPENFNAPFLAANIRDFWNRWHMTLSFWFRDHVYMRFVLRATKQKWFSNRYAASYLGYLVSFGLMGLWHGTQSYYLLYGLYHGLLFIGYDRFTRWNKEHRLLGTGLLSRVVAILITFHIVCFGFLLFSGRLMNSAAELGARGPTVRLVSYEGSIDQADCQFIKGWGFDQTRANDALTVEIYDQDHLLATVTADSFRPDLQNAGKGDGYHGFSIPCPLVLKDGKPHMLVLRVAGTIKDIKHRSFICNGSIPGPGPPGGESGAPRLGGSLDSVSCDAIVGWAWDGAHPDVSVDVALYDGSTLLTKISANLYRRDLEGAGKGNGRHGYSFTVPDSLRDGRPHLITAKIADGSFELKNSPKTLQCPQPAR